MILGFGNNLVSSLASDITASQTTIPVMPGDGQLFATLLTSDFSNKSTTLKNYAKITLTDSGETAFEICHLLSVNGDNLTVIRGQEGTPAKGWSLKDVIANFATRGSENGFPQIAHIQSGFYTSGTAGGSENALTLELPSTFFLNGSADWVLKTPIVVYPSQNNTGAATLQLTMGGRVLGKFPLYKGNKAQLAANDILKDVGLVCLMDKTKTFFSVANPGAIYAGLGTAAFKDVVTSMTDTTAGSIPVVGWMGLGGNALPSPVSSSNDLTKLTGLPYSAVREYTTGDGSVYLIGVSGVSPSGNAAEWLAPENGADGKKIAIRNKDNLFTLYSDKNKPTASDTGALPLSGGTLTSNGAFITLLNGTKGKSNYLFAKDTDGANRWFIGNGSDGSYDTAFSNYKGGGNNIALRADGSITIFAANGKNVNVTGQIIPSVYANFDARYVKDIQLGAQSLSKTANDSGGSLYLPAGCVTTGYTSPASSDANNIHFYYKPIQKSVNGTWYNIAG